MYEQLMTQAETLARWGVGKPRQVDLRRAVSSAYYAVFHLLVEECCRTVFGSQHAQRPYRDALSRAFTHSTMRAACNSFRGGNLKTTVAKGLPVGASGLYVYPQEVRDVARVFADLQEKRHLADYDRGERFQRAEVLLLLSESRLVAERFLALTDSPDRRFFLACLWAWKELANR